MNDGAGKSLIKSLVSTNVAELASEVAEVALDSSLSEGLLKDIPVFGWLVKSGSAISTIRDRLFLKKIALFLKEASNISLSQRMLFEQKMDVNQNLRKKVGESLILLLERHEDLEKSEFLGKVFAKYVSDDITLEEFQAVAQAIDRCPSSVLVALDLHYKKIRKYWTDQAGTEVESKPFNEYLDAESTQQLYVAGLVGTEEYIETTYTENQAGRILLRSAFDDETS